MLEGLPPNSAAHVMRLTSDEKTARAVADLIVETFDPFETACAVFETDPSTKDWVSRSWTAEVFFGSAPDESNLRALIANVVNAQAAEQLVFERLSQKDWVAASLEGLAPVRAGRFLIHGAHDRDKIHRPFIDIEIEAALAFGTGRHGTTFGCLRAMEALAKRRTPRKILDVGAGTGILAIAAARLWRVKVYAGDIDPIAVEASKANARLNRTAPWLRSVLARGANHPLLRANGPYDLVLANILAHPLRRLAPELTALTSADGELILSGLLARDVQGVLSAYRASNFTLRHRADHEGWATLSLRRGGAKPRPSSACRTIVEARTR